MKRLVAIAIIAVASLAATAHAQTTSRVPVSWSDPSRPGLVRVNVVTGAVSVRTHAGKDVIVETIGSTSARGRRQPPSNAEGLTLISPGGTRPTISEAGNVISIEGLSWGGGDSRLDIQVPVKTNLKISAVNGAAISVDGVDGAIEIENLNGDIRLMNVSGSVVANAQNGNVFATIREIAADKPMSFASFNANIDVTLPPTTKANLKLRSNNGETWSDFQMQDVSTSSSTQNSNRNGLRTLQSSRMVSGTINGGGVDIAIQTFNGNIYLRKGK